jgi:hypothetical protein
MHCRDAAADDGAAYGGRDPRIGKGDGEPNPGN